MQIAKQPIIPGQNISCSYFSLLGFKWFSLTNKARTLKLPKLSGWFYLAALVLSWNQQPAKPDLFQNGNVKKGLHFPQQVCWLPSEGAPKGFECFICSKGTYFSKGTNFCLKGTYVAVRWTFKWEFLLWHEFFEDHGFKVWFRLTNMMWVFRWYEQNKGRY